MSIHVGTGNFLKIIYHHDLVVFANQTLLLSSGAERDALDVRGLQTALHIAVKASALAVR